MDPSFVGRGVNVGFPAAKKRNEIFQMAMLEPKLAFLDETDSGRTLTRCALWRRA